MMHKMKRHRSTSDRKATAEPQPSTSADGADGASPRKPNKYDRIIIRPVQNIPVQILEKVRTKWHVITKAQTEMQRRQSKNSLGYALKWSLHEQQDQKDLDVRIQAEVDEVVRKKKYFKHFLQNRFDVYENKEYYSHLALKKKIEAPILLPNPIDCEPPPPKPKKSKIAQILEMLDEKDIFIVDITIPSQPDYPYMAEWATVNENVLVPDELTLRFLPSIEGDQNPDDFLEELMEAFNKQEWKRKYRYAGIAMHELINVLLCDQDIETNPLKELMTNHPDICKQVDKKDMIVFHLITAALPQFQHPQRLKDKHDNFLEDFYGIPRYTETMSNIDRPELFKRIYSADEALHSHYSLFCRRCFKYDCNAHAYYTAVYRPLEENLSVRKACGPQCFLNVSNVKKEEFPLIKQEEEEEYPTIPAEDVRKDHWLFNELTVLNVLIRTFNGNACSIAATLGNKTCAEVFARAETLKLEFKPTDRPGPSKQSNCKSGNAGKMPKKKKSGKSWAAHYNKLKTNESFKRDNDDCAKIFIPCDHPLRPCDKECPCVQGNYFCEKYCNCTADCPERFPGCKCKAQCTTRACPCFSAVRECDPDLCQSCNAGAIEVSQIKCRNVNIQRGLKKHLLVSHSQVAGWGAYLNGVAEKNEFISEYCGEIISHDEADRRGKIYDKQKCSFLFNLNTEQVIDAKKKGNKIRFANHSENPNCYARVMMVNGDHRIGIYALQHIKPHEELFFDYRYGKNDKLKFVNAEKPLVSLPGVVIKTEIKKEKTDKT